MATALNSSALVHQRRHLLSPPAMHGFVHDQCENFSFSVFLDLCMISVRVCGMVREREQIQLCRHRSPSGETGQSTRFATLKLNLPKSHGVPSDGRKKHINVTAGAQLRRTQSSPVQCNAASVKSGQECNESFPNVQRAFPTTLQGQFPTWWRRGALPMKSSCYIYVFFSAI